MGYLKYALKQPRIFIFFSKRLPGLIAFSVILTLTPYKPGLQAQEETILQGKPPEEASVKSPQEDKKDGLFFADVLVREQPVFQVGSLSKLSAAERTKIINRRIAGLLNQSDSLEPVTVQFDQSRQIALLSINNRVLMTVTEQDAMDFDTTVEDLAQQRAEQLNLVLTRPNLAIDVLQRLHGTARQLGRRTIDLIPSLLGSLFIVGMTWVVAKGVRRLGALWAKQTDGDRSTEILIGRLCYGGIWVLGSIIALSVLGLDFAALLGAFGLTSVAIGFSLKDVLSNYMSGVILLAARPFRINDQVVVGNYEGTIVQIQLRATTMLTYDGRLVYIPNQQVFQSSVINNTASPVRRSEVMVGVDYDADLNRVRQVILKALMKVQGIEIDPTPLVLVRELSASTINIQIRFWVNSRQQSYLQVTSDAAQAIKEQLQVSNIEMPTEIYTLMFRDQHPQQSEGLSEPMVAPPGDQF